MDVGKLADKFEQDVYGGRESLHDLYFKLRKEIFHKYVSKKTMKEGFEKQRKIASTTVDRLLKEQEVNNKEIDRLKQLNETKKNKIKEELRRLNTLMLESGIQSCKIAGITHYTKKRCKDDEGEVVSVMKKKTKVSNDSLKQQPTLGANKGRACSDEDNGDDDDVNILNDIHLFLDGCGIDGAVIEKLNEEGILVEYMFELIYNENPKWKKWISDHPGELASIEDRIKEMLFFRTRS